MILTDLSLLFDAVLAILLAVMIYYSIRLNKRIVMLRDGEGELQKTIAEFNNSSALAQDSAQKLRAAGTEAEFGVKAAIAKGMALRNDLEMMLDQADLLIERLDQRPAMPSANDRGQAKGTGSMPAERPQSYEAVEPFRPPVRSAEEIVRAEQPAEDPSQNTLTPRTEAERQLLDAIRAAKEGAA